MEIKVKNIGTVLHQFRITFLIINKNSTNQKRDRKILLSDWLFQFLQDYSKYSAKIETANQKTVFL